MTSDYRKHISDGYSLHVAASAGGAVVQCLIPQCGSLRCYAVPCLLSRCGMIGGGWHVQMMMRYRLACWPCVHAVVTAFSFDVGHEV